MARKKNAAIPPSDMPTDGNSLGVSGEKPKTMPNPRRKYLKWTLLLLVGACGFSYWSSPKKPTTVLPTAAVIPTDIVVSTAIADAAVTPGAALAGDITVQALAVLPRVVVTEISATAVPSATITDTPTIIPATATAVPTVSAFEPFNETTYAVKIMDTLFIGSGGRELGTVRVADGRPNGGERAVIVPYNTTEVTTEGQVEEVADLYQSIGISIRSNKLDVDSVSLIMGVNEQATLIMVATAADTVSFASGAMRQADFLGVLQVTDMTGTGASSDTTTNQSSAASNARRETRLIASTANIRTCPRRTDECLAGVQLQPGATITVTGDIQGDSVSQSTLWYVAEYQGKVVYVHSSLVAAPGTTSLPSAPVVSQPANQPVIIVPSNNQSVVPVQAARTWDCSGDIFNCDSFFNRAEMDSYFAACPGDPSNLDGNNDGSYCES